MKANHSTKLLQESQKKVDFNRGEKEAMVKKQNREMLRSNEGCNCTEDQLSVMKRNEKALLKA